MALLDKEIDNEAERELGPLKYLAETTGQPMNKVVNWFLLLIIFVFDPLAIALVVAANFAFAQIRKPEDDPDEEYFQSRNKEIVKVVMSVPEGKEFNTPYPIKKDNTIEPSESLKQRVKENQDKIKDIIPPSFPNETMEEEKWLPEPEVKVVEEVEEDVTNKRMDIIGQNGNDGLHYEDYDEQKEVKIESIDKKEEGIPGHIIKQQLRLKRQRERIKQLKERESTPNKILTYKSNR